MPRASLNGVDTYYEVQGEGTPVLFIHGGYGGAPPGADGPQAPIKAALPAERFRLVTYDRRCAGQSQYVLGEYTLEDLARDAAALLDHLGIARAIVVGSSAGGPVALQFALTRPERVIALCLPNTGPNLMDAAREVSRRRIALVERLKNEGPAAVFASRKERLRNPRADEDASEAERRRHGALAGLSDDDLYRYSTGELRNFAAYAGFDFATRLRELRMPVCVIHGTADQTVPFAWGEALHKGIAGSEFHAIEGGTHGIIANPEAAAVLRDWCDRVSTDAVQTA